MKQGRANRDVKESRANTWIRPSAIRPAGVAQYGQAQGNHVTDHGSTGYHGLDAHFGVDGYKAPKGPAQQSGVGGGRRIYTGGSQGKR